MCSRFQSQPVDDYDRGKLRKVQKGGIHVEPRGKPGRLYYRCLTTIVSSGTLCGKKKKKAASGQEIFSHAGMFLLEQHGYTAPLCWLGKKD